MTDEVPEGISYAVKDMENLLDLGAVVTYTRPLREYRVTMSFHSRMGFMTYSGTGIDSSLRVATVRAALKLMLSRANIRMVARERGFLQPDELSVSETS